MHSEILSSDSFSGYLRVFGIHMAEPRMNTAAQHHSGGNHSQTHTHTHTHTHTQKHTQHTPQHTHRHRNTTTQPHTHTHTHTHTHLLRCWLPAHTLCCVPPTPQ